jgi:DUF4097 and DUF4098 domain-containing protein YvlB
MLAMFLLGALTLGSQQTDTTFAVRPGGTVIAEAWGGRVNVRSWDQARMRVQARHPADVEIEIEVDGSTVHIDAQARRGRAADVDLDITVPRRFGAEIEGVQIEVDVADLEGDVSVETVQGAVRIANVSGRIAANSTQGLVTTTGSRGSLMAETVNDGIRITDHEGEITAETVNGPVTLTGIRSASVTAETMNGEIRFDGEIREAGRYRFETHNGDLVVAVPQGTNATVSIETYSGNVEADFPIQFRGSRDWQNVSFDIGRGGARLELSSFGGAIRLRSSATGRR